jgi:hypothetical protein
MDASFVVGVTLSHISDRVADNVGRKSGNFLWFFWQENLKVSAIFLPNRHKASSNHGDGRHEG